MATQAYEPRDSQEGVADTDATVEGEYVDGLDADHVRDDETSRVHAKNALEDVADERGNRDLGASGAERIGGADVAGADLLQVNFTEQPGKDLPKGNTANKERENVRENQRPPGSSEHPRASKGEEAIHPRHRYSLSLSLFLARKRRRIGVPLKSKVARMRFSMYRL